MRIHKKSMILVIFFISFFVEARTLHILHTNDLHSYFQGYRNGLGGYAKLMTKIQELKSESQSKGIEVLHLDGGDFGEGTSFFLSENGATSIKALGVLGVDVSVIGNHDHMLGGSVLGDQIRRAKVSTKFLSANLVQTKEMNLSDLVKPYVDLERAGIKIRIIGLSTSEAHYQYPLLPGFILPPVPIGIHLGNKARESGKELVIALTHIGQKEDEKLARESSEIDLIVGGHSHHFLDKVNWQTNKKNRSVPIVQAGSHGLALGSLMLDVSDAGEVKVLNYTLHQIPTDLEENSQMLSLVDQAVENRNNYFQNRWDEVIGESYINLSGHRFGAPILSQSCWGQHMARISKESTGSDIGVHLAIFEGEEIPAGPIKFGDIIDNFPHFRKYGDRGWEMTTIEMKGIFLKLFISAVVNITQNFGVNYHGLSFKTVLIPQSIPYIGGRILPTQMKINGEKINHSANYKMAFPAEVAFAIKESLPEVAKKIFPGLHFTGKFYWTEIERYIRQQSPIKCDG